MSKTSIKLSKLRSSLSLYIEFWGNYTETCVTSKVSKNHSNYFSHRYFRTCCIIRTYKSNWAVFDRRDLKLQYCKALHDDKPLKCIGQWTLPLLWSFAQLPYCYYNDVTMGSMASQITSIAIVYSAVYSRAHQRKHQSCVSQAFVRVNSPHKWPVTRKMFPFHEVIMMTLFPYIRDTNLVIAVPTDVPAQCQMHNWISILYIALRQ